MNIHLQAIDNKGNKHNNIVALEVFNISNYSSGTFREGCWYVEHFEIQKLTPWSDLLFSGHEPFLGNGTVNWKCNHIHISCNET